MSSKIAHVTESELRQSTFASILWKAALNISILIFNLSKQIVFLLKQKLRVNGNLVKCKR